MNLNKLSLPAIERRARSKQDAVGLKLSSKHGSVEESYVRLSRDIHRHFVADSISYAFIYLAVIDVRSCAFVSS